MLEHGGIDGYSILRQDRQTLTIDETVDVRLDSSVACNHLLRFRDDTLELSGTSLVQTNYSWTSKGVQGLLRNQLEFGLDRLSGTEVVVLLDGFLEFQRIRRWIDSVQSGK